MLDHTLDELLLAHLKTVPALAALHGYTGQDNADHKLPALTVSTSSEPLAGSDTAFRGEAGVIIESEAHDTGGTWRARRGSACRARQPGNRHRGTQRHGSPAHPRLRTARHRAHGGRSSFRHEAQVSLRLWSGVN